MVRAVWVGVAFVCGAVLGILGTRISGSGAPVTATTDHAPANLAPRPAVEPATSNPVPDVAFGSRSPVGRAVPTTRDAPAAQADNGAALVRPASPAGDGTAIRKIDVGDAFHQQIDRPSVPGFPNEFGDAHRTLEQESRDDSWAYQMEAEIQNSLTAFVSTGELQVRFLECRTTLCEMRLYASDSHRNSMNNWQEVMQTQPWIRRVMMDGMAMSGVPGGEEGLWIFRKLPKP